MSCSRQCFDEEDKWYHHKNCATCIGQDSGKPRGNDRFCAECKDYHSADNWPHAPEPTSCDICMDSGELTLLNGKWGGYCDCGSGEELRFLGC